ncbi:MAG: ATP synthase F1 subunit delta [Anaerovoracaceae bacterium]
MELGIAMVYARAMYDVADEMGRVEEIKADMITIQHIFERSKTFTRILENPGISNIKKKEMVKNVLGKSTYKEIVSLIDILIDKGRFSLYDQIVSQYSQIVDQKDKVCAGVIYSAIRLNTHDKNSFEREIGKMLGKKVSLYNMVDRDLIGGVKILVDGKIIDASLQSNLEKMADEIRSF